MKSTPKVLEAYDKAFEIKNEYTDMLMWTMGQYVMCAVGVSLDHAFSGKKAKSEYFPKPLSQLNKPMTKEEIEQKRKEFIAKMEQMKENFDRTHNNN